MLTNRKKIQIEMIKKDVTAAAIGRTINVTRVAIIRAIKGELKSTKLRKAIAEALGAHIEDLWPDEKPRKRAA
jgi:DNA-binding XRE family transcriptional regulator